MILANSMRPHDGGQQRKYSISLLDITVTPLTAFEAAQELTNACGKRLLLNHNLHSAYLHETNRAFRELYRHADWIVIDGTPIRWLAELSARQRLSSEYRIGSTDWIEELPQLHVSRRLFVFGATPESNTLAVRALRAKLPNWTVIGIDGYVADDIAIESIQTFQPDIVLVGLGMPRQEEFLLTNLQKLPTARYATVGGAIDYVAGANRLAPRWLGHIGLEWIWRLACQPRRLAHRYLVEPIQLIGLVAPRYLRQVTKRTTKPPGS